MSLCLEYGKCRTGRKENHVQQRMGKPSLVGEHQKRLQWKSAGFQKRLSCIEGTVLIDPLLQIPHLPPALPMYHLLQSHSLINSAVSHHRASTRAPQHLQCPIPLASSLCLANSCSSFKDEMSLDLLIAWRQHSGENLDIRMRHNWV